MTTTSGTSIVETGPEPSTKRPRAINIMQCPECDQRVNLIQTREDIVCGNCGLVLDGLTEGDTCQRKKSKPYEPNHHFSERMAAFRTNGPIIKDSIFLERLQETFDNDMNKYGDVAFWGPKIFTKIIKDIDLKFYTNYSAKKYHERWIWLRYYLKIENPPIPEKDLIDNLKLRYEAAYKAFRYVKDHHLIDSLVKCRSNIININFLTMNLLKEEGMLDKYGRYFADIKGIKTNYKNIHRYWIAMKTVLQVLFPIFTTLKNERYQIEWKEDDLSLGEIKNYEIYK